ncbi:MAG: ribosomal L7Ae/L30e/S12e/Gadd45 family protein [Lachnospiraceae bacterium]|nr:ribosomal L7Ae/L30e/S12e/Gadd45 family protein [Lachnospiraceae bacterium]
MAEKRDRVLSALSLAAKAGKIKSGEFQTETAVKDGSAQCVLLARDASENTRKKFHDACAYAGIPVAEYGDRAMLGHCIGRDYRASIAVTDPSFAQMIRKALSDDDHTETDGNRGVKNDGGGQIDENT